LFKPLTVLLVLCSPALFAQATEPAPPAPRPVTLDALYSELNVVDAAISGSGRYLAVILRYATDDVLFVVDLKTHERKPIQRVGRGDAGTKMITQLASVYWKSEERLLMRLTVRPDEGMLFTPASMSKISKLGDRLIAINRDGSKVVVMLGENRNAALVGAFNLGAIMSFLPKDPQHILMVVDGFDGRSLFKVNLDTGMGEQIERPSESVVGWWLDVDGNAVVRMTVSNGTMRLFRKDEQGKWRKFYSMRVREMKERADYEPVGPSDQPGKYYVLARPPGADRTGLYLYDIEKEHFGAPVVENPTYDLVSAEISRDGKHLIRHCYSAHVRICSFADAKIDAHMKGVRRYFEESANVYVYDSSEDGKSILFYVEGPRHPPGYYYYLVDERSIETVGIARKALIDATRPRATVISFKSRDGTALTGYLTAPANADAKAKLPLVLMPHGGPEMRDSLTFNPWVQYLVRAAMRSFSLTSAAPMDSDAHSPRVAMASGAARCRMI
jgi:hypothetical protein